MVTESKTIDLNKAASVLEKLEGTAENENIVSLREFVVRNIDVFARSGKSVRRIYEYLKANDLDVGTYSAFHNAYYRAGLRQRAIKVSTARNFSRKERMEKDMKNLIYVGGSKGGTGKSMVCMALVDYMRKTFPEDEILLIETDSSNPDVGRLYRKTEGVISRGLVLNEDSGWMRLVSDIDETSARHVIINSMAASNLGIQNHGDLLDQNILSGRLGVKFNVLWIMNRNKDSSTLLRDFLRWMKSATVYPVLNLYFGKEEEFTFFRASQDIQETILERGGRALVFPNLNDMIADKLYTDEINLENLPLRLKLGMRTGLERWLAQVKQSFDEAGFVTPGVSENA
jgi:hypothetical protein